MDNAIEISDLCVTFQSGGNTVNALNHLNLTVKSGQVFGFLGPNGAGKTTTMHVLLGFIRAASGEARISGTDVQKSIARREIGYLPEHPDTYRFLTGYELLKMTGRLFKFKGNDLKQKIQTVLDQVELGDAAKRRIATYSRGMLQRICLAQALINDPELLILDEPTGGLDPFGRMAIRKIIKELKAKGKTVFFSSHELSEVETVCDHIAIISNGRIIEDGKASELIRDDENLERYFMKTIETKENQ